MNKKKLNIGLLIILLLIYGSVLYKYFGGSPKETVRKVAIADTAVEERIQPKADFELIISDRDPFLDRSIRKQAQKGNTQKKKINIRTKENTVISWPRIEYYGFLKSDNNEKARAVIEIDTKRYNLREGKEIDGLKIKKIFMDSLAVEFAGTTRIIGKKQPILRKNL